MSRNWPPRTCRSCCWARAAPARKLWRAALHELGPRAKQPFVAINCGAIPENLLESELFGHERGAFTGAVKQTVGKIESAHKGTLFLDEIGDLPHQLQVKLLRFLQDQIVERIGGRQKIQVDVRVVSATNANLEEKIAQGAFRGDLFYRMNAVTVRIPPLRERGGDVMLLANFFLNRFNQEFNRNIRGFTEAATAALDAHDWPGNVRELENRMKRAVVMSETRMIDVADLELTFGEEVDAGSRFARRAVAGRAGGAAGGAGPQQQYAGDGGSLAWGQPADALWSHGGTWDRDRRDEAAIDGPEAPAVRAETGQN